MDMVAMHALCLKEARKIHVANMAAARDVGLPVRAEAVIETADKLLASFLKPDPRDLESLSTLIQETLESPE